MNGYQQKQVNRALGAELPLKALTLYEIGLLTRLKRDYWLSEISESQNQLLNEIMGKFA